MIEISITGDQGQSFTGECYFLTKAGTKKRHGIKGEVPMKYWLPARAAQCNLEKVSVRGELVASIRRNGREEYVQKSRYPLRWVVIASSGPWGAARGGTFAARPMLR